MLAVAMHDAWLIKCTLKLQTHPCSPCPDFSAFCRPRTGKHLGKQCQAETELKTACLPSSRNNTSWGGAISTEVKISECVRVVQVSHPDVVSQIRFLAHREDGAAGQAFGRECRVPNKPPKAPGSFAVTLKTLKRCPVDGPRSLLAIMSSLILGSTACQFRKASCCQQLSSRANPIARKGTQNHLVCRLLDRWFSQSRRHCSACSTMSLCQDCYK